MTQFPPKPVIGVPACIREIGGKPFHSVSDKYPRAVVEAADGIPLVIPAFGDMFDLPDLLARLDGLMLTGSPSNVYPSHYGAEPGPETEPHDLERDATTLPLIRATIDRGLPLLAICRGMQELNVALGGTLHARLHELPGRMDHRRPQHEDPDVQYGPRHPVTLTAGGEMEKLAGAREITVNSLHSQALDRLAGGLSIEAVAPDGTIEAVRVTNARNFALGVQWHPEYKALDNPFSTRLFAAFGQAAGARARARLNGAAEPGSRLQAEAPAG
ncbi:MAG: gamma-glutamyl-gamma-aminobutyrate hydrolase family protein [Kiloniellaceae bacterium]